ncbi:MAG TPA: alpha-glucuronidase family glycosyl hydrolase, partial [bacterium]|nr:alpha-glucuronidase family glycosyl hydrolase [bacterium]
MTRISALIILILVTIAAVRAEDGSRLWLRYDRIDDPVLLTACQKNLTGWFIEGDSPVLRAAAGELERGLSGLLGRAIPEARSARR